ncbi:MAG: aromatic amino acid lyase, partial [Myxococcales bacterium]|nr:aromatic amino acid lyase [Myxococcales bacterium]
MIIGAGWLSIFDVLALARGERRATLDDDPSYREKLAKARATVERAESDGGTVYGVTTGVGACAGTSIPPDLRGELPVNLMRFHGCGTGRILDETEAAAVVAVRLITLAKGHSGVRAELLERLCEFLNERMLPRIPEEGSVGASGDLTPLSYLAASLFGEREVTLRGHVMSASEALSKLGLEPLTLLPKESLSIMNGTSAMTAIGAICAERARRLARLASAITAIAVDVTHGNRGHFDPRIFELKPHPGEIRCAGWIRADLEFGADIDIPPPARIQDRYSIRCAPHVIGVL